MNIEYSKHSERRLKERRMSKKLIKSALTDFDVINNLESNKYLVKKSVNEKELNVVFIKKKDYYKIITAYYED